MSEKLLLLNEELEQLTGRASKLRQENKGTDVWPESARTEDEEISNRIVAVTAAIDAENKRKRDALLDSTARYLNEPNYQVKHPVNADDESRRILNRAGWETRGGMVRRQTSLGEIDFCPEEVLYGPIPTDDPMSAAHFKTQRASFQPEYRNAWMKMFRNRGNLAMLTGPEQNALSEGTASEGGFTVPADVAAELLVRRADASVMRGICTVRQTSRDRVSFPAVTPNASSGSIYSSGFVGGMVGERPVNTDAGPTFQQFEIGVKKFEAYTKITNDLIADSGSDMLAFLAADGGRNLGLVEDNQFLNGIGTGLYPRGLLNSGISTADVEGTSSDTITNTTSNAGSAPKIIALAGLVPGQYASNARWLMLRAIKFDILALVDADGRPWWQAAGMAGGATGAPPTLVDFPVTEHAFMPDSGTNGNKVLVCGDTSAYYIVDRTGITVQFDNVNLIGSDETQIFIRSRAGGGLWNTDALRIGIV